eukprot:1180641-Prorocentrum_minimum.AAC.4
MTSREYDSKGKAWVAPDNLCFNIATTLDRAAPPVLFRRASRKDQDRPMVKLEGPRPSDHCAGTTKTARSSRTKTTKQLLLRGGPGVTYLSSQPYGHIY